MSKHKESKMSFENHVMNYLAIPLLAPTEDPSSGLTDCKLSAKCSILITPSKYVQYIKDKINRDRVPFVERKNLDLKKYDINYVCFQGQNQKMPVLPTVEIGDLCTFRCRKCKLHITSYKKLTLHEPKCVGIRKQRVQRLICYYIQKARYHQCRICDKIMLCDTQMIENHTSKKHGMKIEDYMFRIPRHIAQENLVSMAFPNIKNFQLNAAERELVPKESITSDVANLCNFKCDKCCFRSRSFYNLRAHLFKCNGSGKFHSKYLLDAIFHKCKICSVIFLCDKVALWHHVNKTHNLKITEYERISLSCDGLVKDNELTEKGKTSCSADARSRTIEEDRSVVQSVTPLNKATNPKGSLPDHLTTDKVGNLCLFACDQCNFKSFVFGGMLNHNRRMGHGSGTGKFDKKFVKEAKYHKCVICAAIILCDKQLIKDHAKDKHGLTLKTYMDECSNLESRSQIQSKHKIYDGKDKINQEVDIVSHKYLNLCVFECDKCNTTFGSWRQLIKHFNVCKKSNFCKNFDEKYIIKKVLHRCFICGKTILCDRHKLSQHISSHHKLTGSEYIAIIDNANKANQPRSKIKQVQIENNIMDVKVSVFPASLSKSSKSFVICQGQLDGSNMTSHVSNLCIFSCVNCGFKAKNWSDMSTHIQETQHKVYGNSFHRDYVLEAVYHKCHICGKGILCDKELIRNHIRGAHKIFLLANYENQSKNTRNITKSKSDEKNHKKLIHEISQDQIMTKAVNACMFACDKCSYTHKNYRIFRTHKLKQHGDSKFKFDIKYLKGTHYYFQCPLCETCVLCDRGFIFNHVSVHKFARISQFDDWCAKNAKKGQPSK